eukprot:TRINITY_DN8522_c0_g1_i1.p1 TRINITY_DN8522_c0_g1~~TRINITY_DN8522_c0_g1_i1.p1  ORF type:complete len:585 (+),score=102.57 TRINITY_DN8522_c0_g1_i1:43-1797(+)
MRLSSFAAFSAALMSVSGWKTEITMRDGFNLSTDISCNIFENKQRTVIFDTSTYGHLGLEELAEAFAEGLGDDYCAVKQDMRGSGQSQGQDFTLWRSQANDSYDTFQWIANQSWANGDIYQVGVSADGLGTYATALSFSPHLKKQFVVWASADPYSFVFPGGAFRERLCDGWLKDTFPDQWPRLLEEAKSHESPGEWWDVVNKTGKCDQIAGQFPSVLLAGWFDVFMNGDLEGFTCYNKNLPEKKTYMVVEPCGHCLAFGCPIYAGVEGNTSFVWQMAFDLFKGVPLSPKLKPLTFYVLGAGKGDEPDPTAPGNYWTSVGDWPTPQYTKYFLTNDGRLTETAPSGEAKNKSFIYNPDHPVQTHGGNNLLMPCGCLDQRDEHRDDILIFTSEVLSEDLAVTGHLSATLFVSSNCTDTDFTAKLTDVYPNGKSISIQDGIIRMRRRNGVTGGDNPQLMTPGVVYEVTIDMWSTSFIFAAGHKLRLAVSSSNHPRFLPNRNNGLPITQNGTSLIARNTLHMEGVQLSHLTLPVVQKSQLPEIDPNEIEEEWIKKQTPAALKAFESFKQNKNNLKRVGKERAREYGAL